MPGTKAYIYSQPNVILYKNQQISWLGEMSNMAKLFTLGTEQSEQHVTNGDLREITSLISGASVEENYEFNWGE